MRLQLIGKYSVEDFERTIKKIVADLEKNHIHTLSNVNFYFRMHGKEKFMDLYDEDGEVIEHMIYDFKREKKPANLPTEFKIVSSHKVDTTEQGENID